MFKNCKKFGKCDIMPSTEKLSEITNENISKIENRDLSKINLDIENKSNKEIKNEINIINNENIEQISYNSLIKKLYDREITTEIIKTKNTDKDGNIKESKITKKKTIFADLEAIKFVLRNFNPKVWDTEKHRLNLEKIENMKRHNQIHESNDNVISLQERFDSYFK